MKKNMQCILILTHSTVFCNSELCNPQNVVLREPRKGIEVFYKLNKKCAKLLLLVKRNEMF